MEESRYDNGKELADEGAERVRADLKERGYFQVVVHDASTQPLGLITDGNQSVLIVTSVRAGEQFRLRTITVQNAAADRALNISTATLREQFHVREGDLFNTAEVRAGLDRVRQLYVHGGYADAVPLPDTKVNSRSQRSDLTIRVREGVHTPYSLHRSAMRRIGKSGSAG